MKSAAEKGSETERVDPRQRIGRSGRQEPTRPWTTLGTQHGLLRVCEPREGGQALRSVVRLSKKLHVADPAVGNQAHGLQGHEEDRHKVLQDGVSNP